MLSTVNGTPIYVFLWPSFGILCLFLFVPRDSLAGINKCLTHSVAHTVAHSLMHIVAYIFVHISSSNSSMVWIPLLFLEEYFLKDNL